MALTSTELREKLRRLEAELAERQAALPRHSLRPHQLLEIERLEEEIAELKAEMEKEGKER
jgi:hypothetical protein